MKNLLLSLVAFGAFAATCHSQTVTYGKHVHVPEPGTYISTIVTLTEGQRFEVLSVATTIGSFFIEVDGKFWQTWEASGSGNTYRIPSAATGNNIVVGPCTITCRWENSNPGPIISYKISEPDQGPTVSRNVAVIPEDVNGEYEVILESSTDMITWSPANPGNYGGNTAGRFFRIRMEKTN